MSRTVLFVVYYFPPAGGGGVQRPTKFVRYLPEYGWNPVVLTIKNPAYGIFDETLLDELPPDLPIYRTNAFQPTSLYFKVKQHYVSVPSTHQQGGGISSTPLKKRFVSAIRRGGRKFFEWVMIPDDKIGWTPYALRAGQQIVANHSVDLIFTTSAPYTAHIIGARLKRKTGLPWVMDFPDPFVSESRLYRPTPIHTWLHKDMEKKWVTLANRVITTTDPTTQDFAARYPDLSPDKWLTITCGYDEQDFAGLEQITTPQKFELYHVGTLYQESSPDPDILLRAIRHLLDHDSQAAADFRLILVGEMDMTYREQLAASIQRWQLANIVQTRPVVPHREAVNLMCRATALVMMLKDGSGMDLRILGKTFEYLRAKRPILILTSSKATCGFMQGRDSAFFVKPNDYEDIARQLQTWLVQWRAGKLPTPANPGYEQFEHRVLARHLAQTFDDALGTSS